MTISTDNSNASSAREVAISSLRQKRSFQSQLVSYVVLNVFLWGIWFFTKSDSSDGYWPAWVTLGCGIALAFAWWHAYGEKPITEDEVEREMQRTKGTISTERP